MMNKLGLWALLMTMVVAPAAAQSQDEPTVAGLPGDYLIGVSDVLRISVWGETSLDRQVRVRPDGKVSFPLVNDIAVVGLSPEEVRNLVTNRLSAYLREPNVSVVVEQINSFTVYILGEVAQQGPLTLRRPTRLLQALASAGGLNQFSKNKIILVREIDGVERRTVIDYKRLFAGSEAEVNIYLKPGDLLLVQ